MKKATEIAIILDSSSSMGSLSEEIVDSFNKFIDGQKEIKDGEATISLAKFATRINLIYDRIPLAEMPILTMKDYSPGGLTALYDAVGRTITNMGTTLSNMEESDRPQNVIIVIITDGRDNMSREFNPSQIKEMIELQESVYNWNIIFLAANQNACVAGGLIGIRSANTLNFDATKAGVDDYTDAITCYASSLRSGDTSATLNATN